MKNILLLGLFLGITIPSVDLTAQSTPGITYRNRSIFGTALSLGYYNYGYMGSRSISFPPVTAYLEIGLHDNITAGPFLGHGRWRYRYTGFAEPYNYAWSHTNLGGRSSLHLTRFLNNIFGTNINEDRTDWYVTLLLGMEYRVYSTVTGDMADNYSNSFHLMFGPMGGVRYYTGNYLAFFFEAGRGNLGFLSLGLSLRI
jgi:hypothetical protein